ncbi:MAG: hypothetical protein QOJ42_7714 [Acidobacteriaceae bacterium]|jgi:hypothetical protein|nr:hypothetical protein [Acidobacteriaceae bacterium]
MLRIEGGHDSNVSEDRGRLVLEPSNYAAIYALQGSLADFPLEEELAEERGTERERENKR